MSQDVAAKDKRRIDTILVGIPALNSDSVKSMIALIEKLFVTLHPIAYFIHNIKYKRMSKTLVQARIEPEIKEKAESYFRSFGIDTATAIRMYFAKVVELGRIPFTVGLESEDLYDAMVAEQAYQEYIDSGKKSRPFSELLKELDL
jgi:DNA-damage-inducible protein J